MSDRLDIDIAINTKGTFQDLKQLNEGLQSFATQATQATKVSSQFKTAIEKLKGSDFSKSITSANKSLDRLSKKLEEVGKTFGGVNKNITSMNKRLDGWQKKIMDTNKALLENQDNLAMVRTVYAAASRAVNNMGTSTSNLNKIIRDSAATQGLATQAIQANEKAMSKSSGSLDSIRGRYDALHNATSTVKRDMDSLTKAHKDSEKGLKNYNDLMKASLKSLVEKAKEHPKVADAMRQEANAAKAVGAQMKQLLKDHQALEKNNLKQALAQEKAEMKSLAETAKSTGDQLKVLYEKDQQLKTGTNNLVNALRQMGQALLKQRQDLVDLGQAASQQAKGMKEAREEYVRTGEAARKMSKDILDAAQAATKAGKDYKNFGNSISSKLKAMDQTKARIRELKVELANFQHSFNHAAKGSANFGVSLQQYNGVVRQSKDEIARLETSLKNMYATETKVASGTNALASAERNLAGAVNSVTPPLKKKIQFLGEARSELSRTNVLISDQVGLTRFLARGMFLYGSSLATVDLVRVNIEMESLRYSLDAVYQSVQKGSEAFDMLSATGDRLGFVVFDLAKSYKQFAASTAGTALEGEATTAIFNSFTGASRALNLSVADSEGVFRALSQMISKGKVQAEELRGQLAERLPGAFQMSARAMGVTTAELNKMLENGEVLAETLLPKLASEMMKTFVPTAAQLDGMQANINRMKTGFMNLAVVMGEAGLNDAIINVTKALTDFANNPSTIAIFKALGEGAKWLSENLELVGMAISSVIAGLVAVKAASLGAAMGFKAFTLSAGTSAGTVSALATGLNFLSGGAFAALGAKLAVVGSMVGKFGTALVTIGSKIPFVGATVAALATNFNTFGKAAFSSLALAASAFAGFKLGEWLTKQYDEVRFVGAGIAQVFVQLVENAGNAFDVLSASVFAKGNEIWQKLIMTVKNGANKYIGTLLEVVSSVSKYVGMTDFSSQVDKMKKKFDELVDTSENTNKIKQGYEGVDIAMTSLMNNVNRISNEFNDIEQGMFDSVEAAKAWAKENNIVYTSLAKITEEKRRQDLIAQRRQEFKDSSAKSQSILDTTSDIAGANLALETLKEVGEETQKFITKIEPASNEVKKLQKDFKAYGEEVERASRAIREGGPLEKGLAALSARMKPLQDEMEKAKKDWEDYKKAGEAGKIEDENFEMVLQQKANALIQAQSAYKDNISRIEGYVEAQAKAYSVVKQSATAQATYNERLKEAEMKDAIADLKQYKDGLGGISDQFKAMTEDESSFDKMKETVKEAGEVINSLGDDNSQIASLDQQMKKLVGRNKDLSNTYDTAKGRVKQLTDQLSALKTKMEENSDAVGTDAYKALVSDFDALKRKLENANVTLEESKAKFGNVTTAAELLRIEIGHLNGSDPTKFLKEFNKEMKDGHRDIALATEALAKYGTTIDTEVYVAVKRFTNATEEQAVAAAAQSKHLKIAQEKLERFAAANRSVADHFKDAWDDNFDGTLESFDDFGDTLKNMMNDLSRDILESKVIAPIQGYFRDMLSGDMMMSENGAFNPAAVQGSNPELEMAKRMEELAESNKGLLDGMGDIWDKGVDGLSGAFDSVTSGFSNIFKDGLSGVMGNLNGMMSGGLGMGIGSLGSLFGGEYSGIGSTAGSAIGMLFGPLGSAIGGLAGGFLGKILGGEESDKTQSIQLDLGSGDITQGGFLTGEKFSQENRDIVDEAGENLLNLLNVLKDESGVALDGIVDLAVGSRDGIDLIIDGVKVLDNAKISIDEALNEAGSYMLEQSGLFSDVLTVLGQEGENLIDTFVRLTQQVGAVQYAGDLIGGIFDNVANKGMGSEGQMSFSDALLGSFDSIDEFILKVNNFDQAFITGVDRINRDFGLATKALTEEFTHIGGDLNITLTELKDMTDKEFSEWFLQMTKTINPSQMKDLFDISDAFINYSTSVKEANDGLVDGTYALEDLNDSIPLHGFEAFVNELKEAGDVLPEIVSSFGDISETLAGDIRNWEYLDPNLSELDVAAMELDRVFDIFSKSSAIYASEVMGTAKELDNLGLKYDSLIATYDGVVTSQDTYKDKLDDTQSIYDALGESSDTYIEDMELLSTAIQNFGTEYIKQIEDEIDTYKEAIEALQDMTGSVDDFISSITEKVAENYGSDPLGYGQSNLANLSSRFDSSQESIGTFNSPKKELDNYKLQLDLLKKMEKQIEKNYKLQMKAIQDEYKEKIDKEEDALKDLETRYKDQLKLEEKLADLQKEYAEAQANVVEASMDTIQEKASEVAEGLRESWGDVAKDLKGFLDDTLLSDLSTLRGSEKTTEAGSQYQELLAKAKGGDVEAAQQLGGAATTYLENARSQFASGQQYTDIFNQVMREVGAVQQQAAAMEQQAEQQQKAAERAERIELAEIEAEKIATKMAEVQAEMDQLSSGQLLEAINNQKDVIQALKDEEAEKLDALKELTGTHLLDLADKAKTINEFMATDVASYQEHIKAMEERAETVRQQTLTAMENLQVVINDASEAEMDAQHEEFESLKTNNDTNTDTLAESINSLRDSISINSSVSNDASIL